MPAARTPARTSTVPPSGKWAGELPARGTPPPGRPHQTLRPAPALPAPRLLRRRGWGRGAHPRRRRQRQPPRSVAWGMVGRTRRMRATVAAAAAAAAAVLSAPGAAAGRDWWRGRRAVPTGREGAGGRRPCRLCVGVKSIRSRLGEWWLSHSPIDRSSSCSGAVVQPHTYEAARSWTLGLALSAAFLWKTDPTTLGGSWLTALYNRIHEPNRVTYLRYPNNAPLPPPPSTAAAAAIAPLPPPPAASSARGRTSGVGAACWQCAAAGSSPGILVPVEWEGSVKLGLRSVAGCCDRSSIHRTRSTQAF